MFTFMAQSHVWLSSCPSLKFHLAGCLTSRRLTLTSCRTNGSRVPSGRSPSRTRTVFRMRCFCVQEPEGEGGEERSREEKSGKEGSDKRKTRAVLLPQAAEEGGRWKWKMTAVELMHVRVKLMEMQVVLQLLEYLVPDFQWDLWDRAISRGREGVWGKTKEGKVKLGIVEDIDGGRRNTEQVLVMGVRNNVPDLVCS